MRIFLFLLLILSLSLSYVHVDGREAGKHAAKAAEHAQKAGQESAEAVKLKAEDVWEGVKDGTLADNLRNFLTYSKETIDDALLESEEFRERLLKATGMEDKTLRDHLADVLESVHLKSPSKAKIAANKLASAIPDMKGMRQSFQDIDVSAWPQELKGQYESAMANLRVPDNVWKRTLKKLGLKEKSTVEKAAAEYFKALHDFRVTVGMEDRTMREKLSKAIHDSTSSVSDLFSTLASWVRMKQPSTDDEGKAFLESTREKWEDSSAKAISKFMTSRDALLSQTEDMLVAAGLKEKSVHKGRLQKARDDIDRAFHKLGVALGWTEPTLLERFKAYTSGGHSLSDRLAGISSSLGSIPGRAAYDTQQAAEMGKEKISGLRDDVSGKFEAMKDRIAEARDSLASDTKHMKDKVMRRGREGVEGIEHMESRVEDAARGAMDSIKGRVSSVKSRVDRVLHNFGLVSRETADEAANKFYKAGKSVRDRVASEYSDLSDKMNLILEDQRNKINEALQSAYENLPPGGDLSGMKMVKMANKQMSKTTGDIAHLPESVSEYYESLTKRLHDSLTGVQDATDSALSKLGIREPSKLEEVRSTMRGAWRDFRTQLGFGPPTLKEQVIDSFGNQKDIVGDRVDKILKTMHLKEKSLPEKVEDRVDSMVGKVQSDISKVRSRNRLQMFFDYWLNMWLDLKGNVYHMLGFRRKEAKTFAEKIQGRSRSLFHSALNAILPH